MQTTLNIDEAIVERLYAEAKRRRHHGVGISGGRDSPDSRRGSERNGSRQTGRSVARVAQVE